MALKNIFKLFAGLLFAFYLLLGNAFPAEAGIISKQQEIEMGRETAMALEAQYGVVQDYELQERVNRIGQSLVAVSDRQDLEYTFKVLNCDEVNALACPGGFVYVFKGLIDYMPSDSELAGVLGHEVSHIVEKHTVHQIEKQLLTTLLLAVATKGDMGLTGLARRHWRQVTAAQMNAAPIRKVLICALRQATIRTAWCLPLINWKIWPRKKEIRAMACSAAIRNRKNA